MRAYLENIIFERKMLEQKIETFITEIHTYFRRQEAYLPAEQEQIKNKISQTFSFNELVTAMKDHHLLIKLSITSYMAKDSRRYQCVMHELLQIYAQNSSNFDVVFSEPVTLDFKSYSSAFDAILSLSPRDEATKQVVVTNYIDVLFHIDYAQFKSNSHADAAKKYLVAIGLTRSTLFKLYSQSSETIDKIGPLYLNYINETFAKLIKQNLASPILFRLLLSFLWEQDRCGYRLFDNIILKASTRGLTLFQEMIALLVQQQILTLTEQIELLTTSSQKGVSPLHELLMTNDPEKLIFALQLIKKLPSSEQKKVLLFTNKLNITLAHQFINNGKYLSQQKTVASIEIARQVMDDLLIPNFTWEELSTMLLRCDSHKINGSEINKLVFDRINGLRVSVPNFDRMNRAIAIDIVTKVIQTPEAGPVSTQTDHLNDLSVLPPPKYPAMNENSMKKVQQMTRSDRFFRSKVREQRLTQLTTCQQPSFFCPPNHCPPPPPPSVNPSHVSTKRLRSECALDNPQRQFSMKTLKNETKKTDLQAENSKLMILG